MDIDKIKRTSLFVLLVIGVLGFAFFSFRSSPQEQETATNTSQSPPNATSTAKPSSTSQTQPASPSKTASAASSQAPVDLPGRISPVSEDTLKDLATSAVEYASVLENPAYAPPDKLAKLDGHGTPILIQSLALQKKATKNPPSMVFDKTVEVTPSSVTFEIINKEFPDSPRFLTFIYDGQEWGIGAYEDTGEPLNLPGASVD